MPKMKFIFLLLFIASVAFERVNQSNANEIDWECIEI
jgi:hypothetical protein